MNINKVGTGRRVMKEERATKEACFFLWIKRRRSRPADVRRGWWVDVASGYLT